MFAHITTNAQWKIVEIAIVNAEGGVLHSEAIGNFSEVAIIYRAYRHQKDPSLPKFVDVEPKLRRQYENLSKPLLAEQAQKGAIAA